MPKQSPKHARFMRAIHIQRDFRDLRYRLDGYQLTPLVCQLATRIIAGLDADSSERAFSLIGPFGSGKSAFGLFMAHFFQRDPGSRQSLLHSLGADAAAQILPLNTPSLLPVLVSGNNSSLRNAILRSLDHALDDQRWTSAALKRLRSQLDQALQNADLDPQHVADLLALASQELHRQGYYAGLILVVDELGQFLDYAARQDDERDLFVLQCLAEAAARSGDTPMLVLTILHQAFDRYVVHAGASRRIEWAKVQGRFVDLTFQEPASQMIRMLALALAPERHDPYHEQRVEWAARMAPLADSLGLRPRDMTAHEWEQMLANSYPIHPTVLIALPFLFRQLAQNERSMFAFLFSDEPWALRDVLQTAQQSATTPIYRLTHLYAYIEANLGSGLFGRTRGQRWAELAEARAALVTAPPLQLDLLTLVGTIGALERSSGLHASQAQLCYALSDTSYNDAIIDALAVLQGRRMLVYRQHRDSYILWEGSDLDLEAFAQEARRELGRCELASLLQQHADSTPRIARRHSYRSGATRVFALHYVSIEQIQNDLAILPGYDGELLHVLPADQEELDWAEQWAAAPERRQETARIIVLPERVRDLRDILLDVAALRNVLEDRAELESDRVARREVAGRLLEAQQALAALIAESYAGRHSHWYYQAEQRNVATALQIDELLSSAADLSYPRAPRIWNELIIRRQLSAAASKARRNLVEAILEYAHVENLGLQGFPPERAIYESVLRAGGLHRQTQQGDWIIADPPDADPLHLRPAWDELLRLLSLPSAEPQPLRTLFASLEAPPYGLKAGLTPLLFMLLYVTRAGEINIYERQNYVPDPDIATFERLLTRPDHFAVRLSRADGARQLAYERLAQTFEPRALQQAVQPALLRVALPMLRLLNKLPAFTKHTSQLSQPTQAVRQALREARSPDELLFDDLPQACGIAPINADSPADMQQIEAFIERLSTSIQELKQAYPQLLSTLEQQIVQAFHILQQSIQARSELQQRYEQIAATSNDSQLQAVGLRLETADTQGLAWVESLAALVLRRPPELWNDADLPAFTVAIADLGRRFCLAEELALTARALPADSHLLRIGIANGHGEVSRVLHIHRDPMSQQLMSELQQALGRYSELSDEQRSAAMAEVLQGLLVLPTK